MDMLRRLISCRIIIILLNISVTWRSTQQTKKVVQYVNKVGEKFYARKKNLPFVLNPPQGDDYVN